jgi:hypothetical protein
LQPAPDILIEQHDVKIFDCQCSLTAGEDWILIWPLPMEGVMPVLSKDHEHLCYLKLFDKPIDIEGLSSFSAYL